jgi:hypothetical protein
VVDKRPWEPYGRIDFVLKQDDVPDTTENGCGSAGGDGHHWILPRVDPVQPGREQAKTLALLAARKGQLVDGESSGTDSEEDEEGSDIHKLAKIKHALEGLSQPVQIIPKGRHEWEGTWEEVSYCRTYLERIVPEDILEPLRITARKLGELILQAGAVSLPVSIQRLNVEREPIEVVIIIHLLGLAPAGYLTAPHNGASAGCGVVQVKASVDALCH